MASRLSICANWAGACEQMHKHGLAPANEVRRVARIHRDPFEPIVIVLEADGPVGEYRKITEEVLRLMPDERRYASGAEARGAASGVLFAIGRRRVSPLRRPMEHVNQPLGILL